MAAKLGENIQREWNEDPFPLETWDALEAIKLDRNSGIESLTRVAERGSPLAMMYLGHALTKGTGPSDSAQAEAWLKRSTEGGSIEGRYLLAAYYEQQGNNEAAAAELRFLSDQGYGPAMYSLGSSLYRGDFGYKNLPEALEYLHLGRSVGHLPSIGLLSWIYRKEKFGIIGRISSHLYCLSKIPMLAWYLARYPNSDKLRGWTMPGTV
jgi:TPR repeat protein